MKLFGKRILASKKERSKSKSETCRCESLQKELEALRLNHEAEVAKLREENATEKDRDLHEQQKLYEQKLREALDKQNADALKHQNEIESLKKEHSKALLTLNLDKDKDIKSTQYVDSTRLASPSPDDRLASPGGTPLYADRYDNMPEELKSLNIVLDMKNEELKNLRTKTMELERKLEKHQEIQMKYDALLQKNQSMAEMLKMKANNERQLSVERENLLEKFENESKKVSRLSMEKEQLIWRASNPDLSYRSLTHFEEDEDGEDEERDSPPSPLRSSGSFSANSTPRGPKVVNGHEAAIAKKLKRRSMNF